TPGLERVAELTERIRSAGIPLRVATIGERRRLGEGLEQCAFRIVQESLTNIVKHAKPTEAVLAMVFKADGGGVSVVNDGAGGEPGAGSGRGLIGMAERARIYDGTLSAGPEPGGRFRVELWLPVPTSGGAEVVPRIAAPEG